MAKKKSQIRRKNESEMTVADVGKLPHKLMLKKSRPSEHLKIPERIVPQRHEH